jgi:hypothetical protein
VRGLREATARLGVAVATPPPAHLRTQTLARIAEVRQLPRRCRSWRWSARRPSRRPRLGFGLAAACLIVALLSGIFAIRSQQDLDRARSASQAVAAVLSAPDARTVTGSVRAGGTATVVVSRSSGRIVFASSGLEPLPRSRTHELWLMSPRTARPAGLLRPDAAGRAPPLVAGALGDADRVVSRSSPQPAHPSPPRPWSWS